MFAEGYSEIVLVVADVPTSARFYQEVVGLEAEVPADEAWAWFQVGGGARLGLHKGALLFEEHSPRPEGARFGPVHYAFRVPRERLDAAVAHVRAHGIEVYGPTPFAWMRSNSYYFYDPDGNLLEWWSPDPEDIR